MKDFTRRQLTLIQEYIGQYRNGSIDLNSLVQRIDGLSLAIGIDDWRNEMFSIISDIEQLNAFAIDAKKPLSADDRLELENALQKIEALIRKYEANEGTAEAGQ